MVKDWLIDKEKWKKIRENTFERAKWQCEVCNKRLNSSAPVHHFSYDDYYNINNLVCLCERCHYLVHGDRYFRIGMVLKNIGIIVVVGGALIWWWILPNAELQNIVDLAIMSITIGIGFILWSYKLTQKTKKVRKKIKKAIKNRNKYKRFTLRDDESIFEEKEGIFHCQECGREISEKEYWEFWGLCRRCRGMPLHQGFPAPPGFPKF